MIHHRELALRRTHHVALLLVPQAGLQLFGGSRVRHLTQHVGDLVPEQRAAAPQTWRIQRDDDGC